jgi:hypothetical protein
MGDHLKTLASSFHVRFISNRKSFLPCQLQQERGRVNLVVKIENPSSNLLEICSYISSFFTLPLGPVKDLFLVAVDMAEMIFDYL